ncbi:MAG: hypothetical protein V9F03_08545 [Microthrixaceae bacterium]
MKTPTLIESTESTGAVRAGALHAVDGAAVATKSHCRHFMIASVDHAKRNSNVKANKANSNANVRNRNCAHTTRRMIFQA